MKKILLSTLTLLFLFVHSNSAFAIEIQSETLTDTLASDSPKITSGLTPCQECIWDLIDFFPGASATACAQWGTFIATCGIHCVGEQDWDAAQSLYNLAIDCQELLETGDRQP